VRKSQRSPPRRLLVLNHARSTDEPTSFDAFKRLGERGRRAWLTRYSVLNIQLPAAHRPAAIAVAAAITSVTSNGVSSQSLRMVRSLLLLTMCLECLERLKVAFPERRHALRPPSLRLLHAAMDELADQYRQRLQCKPEGQDGPCRCHRRKTPRAAGAFAMEPASRALVRLRRMPC
jgi:hypothetical protein